MFSAKTLIALITLVSVISSTLLIHSTSAHKFESADGREAVINIGTLGNPIKGFPKTAYKSTNIEGGTMQTTVTIGESGRVNVKTRTFTKVKLKGFTGGVYIVLFTDNGDGHISPISKTYGVDGTWVGRSDRTDYFDYDISPEIAKRVVQVAIVQQHAPRYSDLLDAVVKGSKRFADSFGEIQKNLAPFIVAVTGA